ncbi:uncharacterized protein I303_107906 [Kwoniella dejecticola CBS 10117]|uniref:Tudor domain-containing protein n=1 Tax=Kwoniella dejecticola CBS 10117 TaxID=1296121 RepID=A0A1A5ZW08_9TREE|nr:uncharacterized protein I303_07906 [Kwoniella dejecticola CBS 10117]OBR81993.1 hypothetical protein I303_07906 [Kwoniella dejecticola CBS 10117]
MEAELSTYKDQLAYVNLQLESDPNNEGLTTLKTELVELIDLTQQAMGHPAASSSSSAPATKDAPKVDKGKAKDKGDQYKAGMDCMAKYKDGKWYPAKINAVVGSSDSPQYTITFKGYTTSTNVPLSSLRPHDPNAPIPKPVEPVKRKQDDLTEKEKEKKKKKGEKWMESQKAKADEIKDKKSAWEKFGKKASKKGIHISGLEGKSAFRTPDNPFVGVTGSGRGVTEYERMGKHKFAQDKEE